MTGMQPLGTLSLLSDRPGFTDTVTDRGWHAWWIDSGVSLSGYRAHFDPMIRGESLPFGLVAHADDVYLGSVLVIENDLDARPTLSPWIAALWVEPAHRRQGLAARLIGAARSRAAQLGHGTCYLCATPDKAPYYLARGFRLIESDVQGLDVFVI